MSKQVEVDMKEVELNELDQEKQPMTGSDAPGSEKNGSVKLKVPDDEVKFTGLSKEELMRVAGTPGWVRTRWLLLVLFWLGWLGMLAGAVVIIVQAPPCKPIPEVNWWNEGPVYVVSDLASFTDDKGLEGMVERVDSLSQLKVKGLVVGPLHTVQADQPNTLDLKTIDPEHGTLDQFKALLEKAHKKGISVVLALTPNYLGDEPWFARNVRPGVMDAFKFASEHWMALGVDGIQVSSVGVAAASPNWPAIQAVVKGNRTDEDAKKTALIASAGVIEASTLSLLLNTSDVDLLYSDTLSNAGGEQRAQAVQTVLSSHGHSSVGWALGAGSGQQLANSSAAPGSSRLNQLLLFTLPGTPVFTYGDEMGLTGQVMLWDSEEAPAEGTPVDKVAEAQKAERQQCRSWFKSLSDLRGKERSLLHGDYLALSSSPTALAFLRYWDQSERFVTAVNWGSAPVTLALKPGGQQQQQQVAAASAAEGESEPVPVIPDHARVRETTDPEALAPEAVVPLAELTLGAGQAVLLSFPYVA